MKVRSIEDLREFIKQAKEFLSALSRGASARELEKIRNRIKVSDEENIRRFKNFRR